MIDQEFNTIVAQHYIDDLEDGEDIYEYLQSDMYFKTFKNQLETMIVERGLDRKELNKVLGRVNLSNWLSGKVVPNRANLIKICFALSCDLDDSNMLICKFAGDQELNPLDLDDAVYIFCLTFKMQFDQVQEYINAKNMLLEDIHALDNLDLLHKERFIWYMQQKLQHHETNKDKKINVLNDVIHHPKIYHGEFDKSDGFIRPIAEFIYNESDYKRAMDRIQKLLSGKLPIKRDEFIKLVIACGYSEVDEINEKLEQAGFYPLYPRNQYDCIYISGSINAILNEEPSLADYLIELSHLFKDLDQEEYVIYDVE